MTKAMSLPIIILAKICVKYSDNVCLCKYLKFNIAMDLLTFDIVFIQDTLFDNDKHLKLVFENEKKSP